MWDHRPGADELLRDRLARGWRPTPSRLAPGDRVLGFAACGLRDSDRREPGEDA